MDQRLSPRRKLRANLKDRCLLGICNPGLLSQICLAISIFLILFSHAYFQPFITQKSFSFFIIWKQNWHKVILHFKFALALWKILKEMRIPDHLTSLLRNLYAGQKAIVRTGHGTTGWFQIGKGVCQDCILSPWLFNYYAEYIMRNTGLVEAQTGIKIDGRSRNNLRYTDDTTLMIESEEELKNFLMKVKKKSEKVGLKLNIQKTKIMVCGPITSWQRDGETVETVTDFIFGGSKIWSNIKYWTTSK